MTPDIPAKIVRLTKDSLRLKGTSAGGAPQLYPARKGWVQITTIPKRRRCGTLDANTISKPAPFGWSELDRMSSNQ
jgi:hypothetical protein